MGMAFEKHQMWRKHFCQALSCPNLNKCEKYSLTFFLTKQLIKEDPVHKTLVVKHNWFIHSLVFYFQTTALLHYSTLQDLIWQYITWQFHMMTMPHIDNFTMYSTTYTPYVLYHIATFPIKKGSFFFFFHNHT